MMICKDSEAQKTTAEDGVQVTVYSTDDAIKIVFTTEDRVAIEAGAWITPNQARQLRDLIDSLIMEESNV
jgi:hypothetical protein